MKGIKSIKKLQGLTGANLAECKKVLDNTCGDIYQAIRVLQKKGVIEPTLSKEEIIFEIKGRAASYAKSFLESTYDTGELQNYYEANKLEIIQENYYHWHIAGHENDIFYQFQKDISFLPPDDREELKAIVSDLFVREIKHQIKSYIKLLK